MTNDELYHEMGEWEYLQRMLELGVPEEEINQSKMSNPNFMSDLRAAKCFGKAMPQKEAPVKVKKEKKPLPKRTKQRAKQEREYSKKRKEFLSINKVCLVAAPGCTKEATTVHHIAGRTGKRLTDKENFLPCCMNCHEHIEKNPLMAKEAKFSKSRLAKA